MGHVNLLLAMPLFYMTEKDSPGIERRSLKLEPAEKRREYIHKIKKCFLHARIGNFTFTVTKIARYEKANRK